MFLRAREDVPCKDVHSCSGWQAGSRLPLVLLRPMRRRCTGGRSSHRLALTSMALKPPRSIQGTATGSGPSMLSTIAAAIAAIIGVTTAVLTGGTVAGTGGRTADTGDAGAITTINLARADRLVQR